MRKAEIKIGGLYVAKVSGKLVKIQIDRVGPTRGWIATNMATGRTIGIDSAARLRREANVTRKVEWANRNCFKKTQSHEGCGHKPCETLPTVHAFWGTGCGNLCPEHLATMERAAARQGRSLEVCDLPQEGVQS